MVANYAYMSENEAKRESEEMRDVYSHLAYIWRDVMTKGRYDMT